MMCRWSSQITSDRAGSSFNPSRLLSPPPPLQLLPFLIPLSLSLSRYLPGTWSYRGVSKQLPLTQKLLALIFAINPFCFSFPVLFSSSTFFATSLAEKMHTLFCLTIIPGTFFPTLFFVTIFHFFFISHANYSYQRN